MGFWRISLEKTGSRVAFSSIDFQATRDVNTVVAKLLPISWLRSLAKNSVNHPNYSIDKCLKKILSPDQEDWTDQAIFAVLAYRKDSIQEFYDSTYSIGKSMAKLHSKIGLLLSISEDDQVGLFGIWPNELFSAYRQRPQEIRVVESLLVNRPQFWENVVIMIPSEYDWEAILGLMGRKA